MKTSKVLAPDRVYIQDVYAVQMCGAGGRTFCIRHNIVWADLLKGGVPIDVIIATNDAMALQVVEYVKNGRKL